MKPALVAVLAIFLLAGTCLAQAVPAPAPAPAQSTLATPAAPATPTAAADKLVSGTIVSVELSKALDARKSKANDKIEARTSMDLLMHGQIVIPRNTKILGHVTEAKVHSKESPNSTVGIAFDRVLMKNGRELPLQAAVQAIARPLQPVLAIPSDDRLSPATAGIPSASQGQRTAMAGVPSQPPSSYATLYPAGSASGTGPLTLGLIRFRFVLLGFVFGLDFLEYSGEHFTQRLQRLLAVNPGHTGKSIQTDGVQGCSGLSAA